MDISGIDPHTTTLHLTLPGSKKKIGLALELQSLTSEACQAVQEEATEAYNAAREKDGEVSKELFEEYGLIKTVLRFAGPLMVVTAAATGAVLIFQRMNRTAREMEEAFDDLDTVMEDNADVLADTAENALLIDLARVGREAGDSVGPLRDFKNELTGVAEAFNDVTVARFMEEAGQLRQRIRETQDEINRIESLRRRESPSPSDAYSATGPLVFEQQLTAEQEKRLRNARIQMAGMQSQLRDMGGILNAEQSQDVFGSLMDGDIVTAAQQFRDALKGTLETTKETSSELNKQESALGRLQSLAEKQGEAIIKARGDEIEMIQYRRDQDIAAINEAADRAIERGNDVQRVEMLRNQAVADARMSAEQEIARYRSEEHDRAVSDLERDVDRLLRDLEREVRDRQRMAQRGQDFDRSLQVSTPEREVDWWEQDALAEAQAIRDRELELYRGNQDERLRITEEYLRRESEIEQAAAQDRNRIRQQQSIEAVGITSDFFGTMGDLYAAFGSERSDEAEALFAISKGLNLAQATMNSYVAVTEAWADPTLPFFAKIAASIQAATTVASAIASIRSTQLSGAREMGGPVYAGDSYLVGERGPEVFTPGASGQITSNANLQRAMSSGANDNRPASGTLRLIVPEGWQVQMDDQARRLVQVERAAAEAPDRAMDAVARDVAQGGGKVSGTMESRYGLNRAAGA